MARAAGLLLAVVAVASTGGGVMAVDVATEAASAPKGRWCDGCDRCRRSIKVEGPMLLRGVAALALTLTLTETANTSGYKVAGLGHRSKG